MECEKRLTPARKPLYRESSRRTTRTAWQAHYVPNLNQGELTMIVNTRELFKHAYGKYAVGA
ncbi:MAG: hypothetical protein Q8O57_02550, partial [Kiritimatiellota bacterium]|nr:hypothetical protein [Kiritimatiellota bacterium]